MLLEVEKAKIGPEFVLQNLYGHVIRSFIQSKKKYTFGAQRGENKPYGHKHCMIFYLFASFEFVSMCIF
jgi:hypothetical protein